MARRGQHETSLPENETWDFDGSLDPLGEVIWKYNKNLLGNHENRVLRRRDATGEDGIKRRRAGDRSGRMKTTAMSDSLQALLPQLPPTVSFPLMH